MALLLDMAKRYGFISRGTDKGTNTDESLMKGRTMIEHGGLTVNASPGETMAAPPPYRKESREKKQEVRCDGKYGPPVENALPLVNNIVKKGGIRQK